MKIVVLSGGKSDEHDVSMSSGSMVANALIKKNHQVILLDISVDLDFFSDFDEAYKEYKKNQHESNILSSFSKQNGSEIGKNVLAICSLADIVFIGLHGGIGENGKLAALLDIFGINYTGSGYQGSLLAMDKQITKELIRFNGYPTADWVLINEKSDLNTIKLPAVVKPVDNGSSIGVTIVDTIKDLESAVTETLKNSNNRKVLVESKIFGREFSVGILGDEVLPVIEVQPKSGFYDYKNKYQDGMTEELVPAPISPKLSFELKKMAKDIHNLLGLEVYSRTDFIVSEEGSIYIIEINSLPGMTPNSLLPKEADAAGLTYEELCEKIIELSLKKEKK